MFSKNSQNKCVKKRDGSYCILVHTHIIYSSYTCVCFHKSCLRQIWRFSLDLVNRAPLSDETNSCFKRVMQSVEGISPQAPGAPLFFLSKSPTFSRWVVGWSWTNPFGKNICCIKNGWFLPQFLEVNMFFTKNETSTYRQNHLSSHPKTQTTKKRQTRTNLRCIVRSEGQHRKDSWRGCTWKKEKVMWW